MRIDCVATLYEAETPLIRGKTAIVIDALRATSVMAAALAAGASCIVPTDTVESARQLAREGDVLAGERHGLPIPGFSLGNSPAEFRRETVWGRRIVMTTTNGTQGIKKAADAAAVLTGSFLNASACARAAWRMQRDIVLICSGTENTFALEDGLCAGCIAHAVRMAACGENVELGDFAAAMENAYTAAAYRLEDDLRRSASGRRLARIGREDDIAYCAAVDLLDVVPVLTGESLLPLGETDGEPELKADPLRRAVF